MKRKLFFALTLALCLLCAVFGAACSEEVKLTFETNGGTPVAEIVTDKGTDVTLPTPSKTGFAFDGWYTDDGFSGDKFEGTVSAPKKSTKFYAKWVQGYEVKLDLDGGVLTAPSIWLKEGDTVYDAVRGLTPQKSGLTFGAWFMGESELSRSFRMPAEAVTLTAKYKAEYIIQLYLQNLSRTSYQRADEYETTGSGYVNTAVSPAAPTVTGYTLQPEPEGKTPVSTLTLKESAEENLFSFYYDRNDYPVLYDGNAPAGATVSGQTAYQTVIFGGRTEVNACGFTLAGYRFAGWSATPEGGVDYLPGAELRVQGAVTLYAVWDKGYADRFGSSDLVFFPRTEPTKAVLLRNGMEFEGTREGNTFSFTATSGKTFGGAVIGSYFCYETPDAAGQYVFYDAYPHPEDETDFKEEDRYNYNRTLQVDEYLNAVYTENGTRKRGSLSFDSTQGDYIFTNDRGEELFHTVFQKSVKEGLPDVFSTGGGEFGYYVDTNGEVILLDGYGSAFLQVTLNSGSTVSVQGVYYVEGKGLALETYESYKIVCFINDTSNLLEGGAGWKTYYICALPHYWEDRGEEYGLYYFADTSRGTYENGNETLTLDGHGYYTDSAVYTDEKGDTLSGGYTITMDFVSGTIVDIVDADGNTLKSFHLSADGSFTVYGGPEVPYTEYYLIEGTSMQSVMLAIFEKEYENIEGSMCAEFYARNAKGVGVHAASGYVTSAPVVSGSDILLYEFTRVSVEYGFDDSIPNTMKFTVTRTSPQSSSVWYDCYSVLEQNGVKNYETVRLPDGSTVWANSKVEIDGEGSLYFKGNTVYRCSFPTSRDEYFNETYGELLYTAKAGETVGQGQLFKLTPSDEEGIAYTASPVEGLPTTFFYFDPVLSPDNGPFEDLVLTPDGKAAYDKEKQADWKKYTGSYGAVSGKTTVFGAQVYELTVNGSSEFAFVQGSLYFLGISYPAYFRYVGKEGAYNDDNGGTLTLDGYGTGRYVGNGGTMNGSYYFMTPTVIRLTQADGTQREFELSGDDKFIALDDCYGRWDLVDGNLHPFDRYPVIFFDGKGTYTITADYGNGSSTQGRYELVDAEHDEYVLYQAMIGGKKNNYYVRFMEIVEYANFNCVVRDRAAGLYVNDDYTVLSLNGFGSGTLKGSGYESNGNFRLMDEERGYGYMEFTTANTPLDGLLYHYLLDYEHGTFRILEETGYYSNVVYFAEDLDHIAFRDDGAAFVGNLLYGDYLLTEDKILLYEEKDAAYNVYELPLFGGATYEYANKTYYLFEGTTFSAEGSLYMLDEAGTKQSEKAATFSFEMRPRSIVGFASSFTIDEEVYDGFLLYTYTNKKIDPRIEYENIVYNIDFSRGSDGKWHFVVTDAGVRIFERNDYSDRFYNGVEVSGGKEVYSGGVISIRYNGLGGYFLNGEEPVYSGKFFYLYDENAADKGLITFDNVPESEVLTVGYINLGDNFGGYHDLREIIFTHGGKQYAVDFAEYSTGSIDQIKTHSYLLYGFSEYEEVEADGYTLGVKYLRFNNLKNSVGYGDAGALGKPMAVTLYGSDKKPVVALTSGVRYDNKGVWLVENNGGRAGAAYLISFDYEEGGSHVAGADVQKGTLQSVGLTASYLFYLFIDDEGEIGDIMLAWYAGSMFAGAQDVQRVETEGNVWTFLGRESESDPLRLYTLTFTKGASGYYTVKVESVIAE